MIEKQSISINKKQEESKGLAIKDTKKDENKKEESRKEDQKKEDVRREEPSKENKIEAPSKKRHRSEKAKDIPFPNKFIKVEEDKKPTIANEPHKKEALASSSSEDSDADIFSKDEKKPMLSKSNIFRA